jgi:Ala-tRNA(Pro) deacylase
MPAAKLKAFLDSEEIKYTSILHSVAFTMQEIASLTHIPGRDIAKTVMVFADDRLVMAVVPASKQVSLSRLKDLIPANTITLATEAEFRGAFPDCEVGAMPPFGNLYGLKVYADESLRGVEMIFNAGSHRELIRMSWSDYEKLVQPDVGKFAVEATLTSAMA